MTVAHRGRAGSKFDRNGTRLIDLDCDFLAVRQQAVCGDSTDMANKPLLVAARNKCHAVAGPGGR